MSRSSGGTWFSTIALVFVAVLVIATPKAMDQNHGQASATLVGP
ncbi:MAG TPA: hypothetical protein VFW23_10415 [Tepidisphaeraceae bacterium]|nr:hypothetical protein [Tepidisphaeraceae bacterium]